MKVRKAYKALQEIPVHKAFKDLQMAQPVHRAIKDRKVFQELPDLKVFQV
jgi:hypothetical protein